MQVKLQRKIRSNTRTIIKRFVYSTVYFKSHCSIAYNENIKDQLTIDYEFMLYESIERRLYQQNVKFAGLENFRYGTCIEYIISSLIAPGLLNRPHRTHIDPVEQYALVGVDREAKKD